MSKCVPICSRAVAHRYWLGGIGKVVKYVERAFGIASEFNWQGGLFWHCHNQTKRLVILAQQTSFQTPCFFWCLWLCTYRCITIHSTDLMGFLFVPHRHHHHPRARRVQVEQPLIGPLPGFRGLLERRGSENIRVNFQHIPPHQGTMTTIQLLHRVA